MYCGMLSTSQISALLDMRILFVLFYNTTIFAFLTHSLLPPFLIWLPAFILYIPFLMCIAEKQYSGPHMLARVHINQSATSHYQVCIPHHQCTIIIVTAYWNICFCYWEKNIYKDRLVEKSLLWWDYFREVAKSDCKIFAFTMKFSSCRIFCKIFQWQCFKRFCRDCKMWD